MLPYGFFKQSQRYLSLPSLSLFLHYPSPPSWYNPPPPSFLLSPLHSSISICEFRKSII